MDSWKRRAIGYVAFVFTALVFTALAYQAGMRAYEDRPQSFIDSVQFTVEMFTTTGFGGDSPWESSQMQAFVAVTDLLGMVMLVGALPVVVGPLLEGALSTAAPSQVDSGLSDHVIICSSTARATELVEKLASQDIPYVIVESDRQRADALYEDGRRVIRADPESTTGLEAAGLPDARALFADISDEVDASIVLAARELADDIQVVSVVEEPERAKYHQLAGADHVLSPRQLLGENLAGKVTAALRSDVDETVEIDRYFQLAEVPIPHGSRLAGETLADSELRERSGVSVIGAWFRGEFESPPQPDSPMRPGTVLLVSGRSDQIERFVEMTQSSVRQFGAGKTIIVGHGAVGQTVSGALEEAGVTYTVVDKRDIEGVDVVGDATQEETLVEAGIEEAQTVVLALPDDTTTQFATLVIRELVPDTEIVARIEENANVSKTYRAGADYVLSLVTVTGRMSASYLLEDRRMLSVEQQVTVARTTAPGLVGQTIREASIRNRTGCTVVAIERDGDVVTDIQPGTRIENGDELVIVGSDQDIDEFERSFG